jgi:hypothetical protein
MATATWHSSGALADSGVGGGRTYDAIVGECARRGRASILLTLNPGHFEPPARGVKVEAV